METLGLILSRSQRFPLLTAPTSPRAFHPILDPAAGYLITRAWPLHYDKRMEKCGDPMLANNLAEGLSILGLSCDEFERKHL